MFCSKCGSQVADNAAFCPSCGQRTGEDAPARGIPLAPGGFTPQTAPSVPSASIPAARTAAYPPVATAQPVAYAGFWLRLVAFIIDALILGVPFFFVFLSVVTSSGLLNSIQSAAPFSPEAMRHLLGFAAIPELFLSILVIEWLYYALLESSRWQATVGKKALGLCATDLAGNRMSFGRATGRYFGMVLFRLLPVIGPLLLFPIDCICAGVTEKKQALHDMMAGCLVMRKL
jgi:uncharacterized RDD family membrane protein YckC